MKFGWIRCWHRPLKSCVDWLILGIWQKWTAKWLVDGKSLAVECGVISRTLSASFQSVLVHLFPVSAYCVYTGLLCQEPTVICITPSALPVPTVFWLLLYPPTVCLSVASAYCARALTAPSVSAYRVCTHSVPSDPGMLWLHLWLPTMSHTRVLSGTRQPTRYHVCQVLLLLFSYTWVSCIHRTSSRCRTSTVSVLTSSDGDFQSLAREKGHATNGWLPPNSYVALFFSVMWWSVLANIFVVAISYIAVSNCSYTHDTNLWTFATLFSTHLLTEVTRPDPNIC